MKRGILVSAICGTIALADGQATFEKLCASCHIKEISQKETMQKLKSLKAPPMIEISNRLKSMISIKGRDSDVHRGVVIAFIKDYVTNPDIMKGMCQPMAFERFGQMPSLKGKITEAELQEVAEWIYDYYEKKPFK